MSAPRTPAYTRFKSSMNIDYDAWKEGTPYDIAALSEITPEERDLLAGELCEKSSLDWRDVEALRALATPKAIQRIGHAAEKQTDGADTRYTFDPNIRPHLLDLNSDDYKTYKAAVAWLEQKVANPRR